MPHSARQCAAILLDIIDPDGEKRESYTPYGDDEATANRVTSCQMMLTNNAPERLLSEHGINLWELYYHGFLTRKPPTTEERNEIIKNGGQLPTLYVNFDKVLEYADKFERLDQQGLIRT